MTKNLPAGVWTIASGITSEEELERWTEKAAWADAWTFRNPEFSERKTLAALRHMKNLAPFLAVHGRLDWAIQSQADALILGSRSLPWDEIASIVQRLNSPRPSGEATIQLGASVHDHQEVSRALLIGADFLVFGPVWATPSKEGVLEPRGLQRLAGICTEGLPVVAVGGIQNPEQAKACIDEGAHAVAVLRAYDKAELTQQR